MLEERVSRGRKTVRGATAKWIFIPAVILAAGCSGTDGDTLARVNGEPLLRADFESYLEHKRIPGDQEQKVSAELERYLEREALADIIEQQGVLDARKIHTEVNEFRKQMLISRYMETYLREKVTSEAVKNFYATNPDRFQSEKVHVAHILLRTNSETSKSEKEALETKAQEIYSRATAGEEFAELAAQYSEDQMSAKKGGDLGWVEEGAVDPVFSGTVFKMKEGDVSLPFATPFGFHVVKALEGPKVVKQPFERVKGNIRYELRQRAKQAEMERLRKLMKIEKVAEL